MDSAEVRARMLDALQVDLMGPLASVQGHGRYMEARLIHQSIGDLGGKPRVYRGSGRMGRPPGFTR